VRDNRSPGKYANADTREARQMNSTLELIAISSALIGIARSDAHCARHRLTGAMAAVSKTASQRFWRARNDFGCHGVPCGGVGRVGADMAEHLIPEMASESVGVRLC
jgi:hypothetical protein